ncbi:hypothetical protein T01_12301 [Trichinella spiralis]|uniref:Uncharacterized protein n=1 Tax=Trichinella spiralis TaxID=6334 RepID=A0A0V0YQ61_TRISP|nr:hypothetical protein T01_12301 [Trichinella spiralis]
MFYFNRQWRRPHVRIPLMSNLTPYCAEEDSNDPDSTPGTPLQSC